MKRDGQWRRRRHGRDRVRVPWIRRRWKRNWSGNRQHDVPLLVQAARRKTEIRDVHGGGLHRAGTVAQARVHAVVRSVFARLRSVVRRGGINGVVSPLMSKSRMDRGGGRRRMRRPGDVRGRTRMPQYREKNPGKQNGAQKRGSPSMCGRALVHSAIHTPPPYCGFTLQLSGASFRSVQCYVLEHLRLVLAQMVLAQVDAPSRLLPSMYAD